MARRTPGSATYAAALLTLAATATLVISSLIADCSSDRGLQPPMTIFNRTDLAVEVTIVGQAEDFEELPKMLEGGGMMLLGGPFQQGDRPCIQGRLVATRNGQTVATIDKPCAGSRWEITAEAAS
jgi:hypothetical protein